MFPFILIPEFVYAFLLVFYSYIQRICLGISVKFVHIYTGLKRISAGFFPFILILGFAHASLPVSSSYLQTSDLFRHLWYIYCIATNGLTYAFLTCFRSYSYQNLFRHFCRYSVHIYNGFDQAFMLNLFISTPDLIMHFCHFSVHIHTQICSRISDGILFISDTFC